MTTQKQPGVEGDHAPMKRGALGYPLFAYHQGRTVEWGHWGITFMERQPDERLNFGVIVGSVEFAVGNRGPVDGTYGSDRRQSLQAACDAWVKEGTEPRGFIRVAHEHACSTHYLAQSRCDCGASAPQ